MFENYFANEDLIQLHDYIQSEAFYQISTPQSQNRYIEQFLQEGVLGAQKLEDLTSQQKSTDSDKSDQDTNGLSQKSLTRVKSKFHNYQKHLIITLRKTVKIQNCQNGLLSQIVKQLWKLFCSSKIYNKSLLRILFGQPTMQEQLNLVLFKKQGFTSILDKFDVADIKNAQLVLKNHVLNHFQQNSLNNLLNSRKLPDDTKQLFKKYIMEFILQLREGCVMKRLPKSRKAQIFTSL